MPNLPPSIRRTQLIKALRRAGFKINTDMGKGSHYKLYSFNKKNSIVIPKSLDSPRVRNTLGKFIAADVDFNEFLKEL